MIIYSYTTNLYFDYIMHYPLEVCEMTLPKYIYMERHSQRLTLKSSNDLPLDIACVCMK